MVEHQFPKLRAAGSIPVSRSQMLGESSRVRHLPCADVAQLVEHFLGKEEVGGSIPLVSSRQGCSSNGRAAVSKTAGCGFESCHPCIDNVHDRVLPMIARIKNYFNDVAKEMRKVSWPTRQQLRESTVVVTVACLIITGFVWLVDIVMSFIMQQLY